MSTTSRVLTFDQGTLVLQGMGEEEVVPTGFRWDSRIAAHRAPASCYREAALTLTGLETPWTDQARNYERIQLEIQSERTPFEHQSAALESWLPTGRGVVVLPTGAGKTWVAVLAMAAIGRPALVVTPTIDLMRQWHDVLTDAFGCAVGMVGGGLHTVERLTVTTYDSAWMKMEQLGKEFGLLVFDEVHHLPSSSYAFAAEASIAPFRLGLTATPEREDGAHARYPDLVGPIVFSRHLKEMAGEVLAPYVTVRKEVELTEEERIEYEEERGRYLDFIRARGVRMGGRSGWANFLRATSSSAEGRRALKAWRRQREIARGNAAKLRALEDLLADHAGDRMLIFAAENRTVHQISKRYLVPALTHETKAAERGYLLAAFAEGTLPVLVTSQVLNEGVDVPAANVGVVLSGSGSVREHVQRLGRILRRAEGKEAVLYEVVTKGSAEEDVSERRRQHDAWE